MVSGFDDKTCKVLQRDMTSHSRRGPGGTYSYFKGSDVIKRLNDAFSHGWSSEKLEDHTIEDQVLLLVAVTASTKEGDVITHQGYGSAQIAKKQGKIIDIGNVYKSAYTNAIKKAAEQFGIGLGTDEVEEEVTLSTSVPSPANNLPSNRRPSAAPARANFTQPAQRPPMAARPTMGRPAPLPSRRASGASTAARPAQVSHSPQEIDDILGTAPPVQNTASFPVSAPSTPPGDPYSLEDKLISDVQLKALSNLASMKNRNELILIQGSGVDKESFSELTRAEAVRVIRYSTNLPQG